MDWFLQAFLLRSLLDGVPQWRKAGTPGSEPGCGEMTIRLWSWLIANTDAPDGRLSESAKSFAHPPAVELSSARLDFESYSPESRGDSNRARNSLVTITLMPVTLVVSPVFEFTAVPGKLVAIALDDHPLPPNSYAWDGYTLWIEATLNKPARIRLRLQQGSRSMLLNEYSSIVEGLRAITCSPVFTIST